jgi:penicillin amidase
MTADAEYVLEGLEEPAEILVDRWGVPHVYASSLYDAFRLQGFNAAWDRLWQLVPLRLLLGEPDLGSRA